MQIHDLPNGIKIYFYPLPNSYSVAFGLYVNTGVKNETEANNGITHLLEHLHFRKLGDWGQKEIYHNMNRLGTSLNGCTYKEMLKFSMKVRPAYFSYGLEFFKRILTTYDWTEEQVSAEKHIILNEICSKEPYMSITPYVDELVWKGSCLSMPILGRPDTISDITPEQLTQYKRECFCKGSIALVVTGNITEENIKEAIYKTSEVQTAGDISEKPCLSPVMTKRKPDICYIDRGWDYVDVNISFDIDNSNVEAASLLNSILGGGTGSVLPDSIREDMGLVYDIYSTLDIYNCKSVLSIIFSIDKKKLYKCTEEIVELLNRIKKHISRELTESNMPYFTENIWYLLEDPIALNDEIGWSAFSGTPPFSIEDRIKGFKSITERELRELAQKTFVSSNTAVVVMGNTSKLTKKEMRRIISKLD